jgi:outer membrane biosynthesis protein TonB
VVGQVGQVAQVTQVKGKGKGNSNRPTSAKGGQKWGTRNEGRSKSKINYPTLAKRRLGWGTLKVSVKAKKDDQDGAAALLDGSIWSTGRGS